MTIDGKEYKVRDLMREVVTIPRDTELTAALETLVQQKSNIAVVVDADGKMLGGVSTLDIIKAILPDYIEADPTAAHFADTAMLKEDTLKSASKHVCDFINTQDVTVEADASLLEATVLSCINAQGRIVVVDADNIPVGLLTRTEIKQVLAAFLGIKNDLEEFCNNGDC